MPIVDLPILDPWLAGVVRDARVFRSVEPAAASRSLRIEKVPDGTMTLLFRRTAAATGDVSIAGAHTRALFKTTQEVPLVLAIRFAPGAASRFLGIPARALTDRIVRLEEVWADDARRLLDDLLRADGAPAMLDACARVLRRRGTHAAPRGAALARRAVQLLATRSSTAPRVDAVAAALGVSSRHLRRVFVEHVGVGPKEYLRMARLERAIARIGTDDSWAELASEAGYYDQAHLIGDFRDLVGVTPGAFGRRDRVVDWSWRAS